MARLEYAVEMRASRYAQAALLQQCKVTKVLQVARFFLFGAGCVGKSTIIKQMQVEHWIVSAVTKYQSETLS